MQPKWFIYYDLKDDAYSIQDRNSYIPSSKELIGNLDCVEGD